MEAISLILEGLAYRNTMRQPPTIPPSVEQRALQAHSENYRRNSDSLRAFPFGIRLSGGEDLLFSRKVEAQTWGLWDGGLYF